MIKLMSISLLLAILTGCGGGGGGGTVAPGPVLNAQAVRSTQNPTSVNVSWQSPTAGAASYILQRKIGALGTFVTIAEVTTLSYQDTLPANAAEDVASYRIMTKSTGGQEGEAVTIVSYPPEPPPPDPTF